MAIQFQNEQIIEWVAIICGKLHNKEAVLVDVLLTVVGAAAATSGDSPN